MFNKLLKTIFQPLLFITLSHAADPDTHKHPLHHKLEAVFTGITPNDLQNILTEMELDQESGIYYCFYEDILLQMKPENHSKAWINFPDQEEFQNTSLSKSISRIKQKIPVVGRDPKPLSRYWVEFTLQNSINDPISFHFTVLEEF